MCVLGYRAASAPAKKTEQDTNKEQSKSQMQQSSTVPIKQPGLVALVLGVCNVGRVQQKMVVWPG